MPSARLASLVAAVALAALTPLATAGDLAPPPGPVAPTNRVQLNAQAIGDLPYTINEPGSYVLTSDLTDCLECDDGPSHGILIDANNVTLDLNGFSIIGDRESSIDAIVVIGGRSNIVVKNGIVRDWLEEGVNLAPAINARVENLTVSNCGQDGIRVGFGSTVRDCNVTNCLGKGIIVETGCLIEGCVVVGAGQDGIYTLPVATTNGSTIRDCTVRLCTGDGIDAADGCAVHGCSVSLNAGAGIRAAPGCVVSGCAASLNTDSGIIADASLVRGNTATNNAEPQIDASASTVIENHAP